MSRTYRKTALTDSQSEETYVKDWMENFNPVRYYWVLKSETTYLAQRNEAREIYLAEMKESCGIWTVYERYINPKTRVYYTITAEEYERELRNDYRKFKRDCMFYETGRNTGYKDDASKTVRIANKRLAQRILKDEEYDNVSYPDRHLGKTHKWNWW